MGIIFDIQRCSYHDGPGIRTTIFLKGCQLRCAWCHNPESFSMQPQLQFSADKCIGCGLCASVCPNGVHSFINHTHTVDFTKCYISGKCIEVCPTGALTLVGKEMSAEEVLQIVLQDKAYYEASDGGVTFSGGEPTLQHEFLLELLILSKKNLLHTCVETNGYIPFPVLEKIVPQTDLFLLDYKITDQRALMNFTGASGHLWNDTLSYLQEMKKPVILRMPIIPGINDNSEHFSRAKELKNNFSVIQKIEIMPYHSLGNNKWNAIGLDYILPDLPSASPKQASIWKDELGS